MTDERAPRRGDARDQFGDIDLFSSADPTGPLVYRNHETGAVIDPGRINDTTLVRVGGVARNITLPPPLTGAELAQATSDVRAYLDNIENAHPGLSAALLANPLALQLAPEIGLMMGPVGANGQTINDWAADVTEGVMENAVSGNQMGAFNLHSATSQTMQVFWGEITNNMPVESKDGISQLLAQLSPAGSENVASNALAWMEERDMDDPQQQAELYMFIYQTAYAREQHELGEQGWLVQLFDRAQELVETELVVPAINWAVETFGSADEAVRRQGLTPGQQAMYALGQRPSDIDGTFLPGPLGEMSTWQVGSGAVDAWTEVFLDPINVLAAAGVGVKGIKTVAMTPKAVKAGRLTMAARAAVLPKFASGIPTSIRGGRVARVIYALGAKPWDELVETFAHVPRGTRALRRGTIAGDFRRLLRAGEDVKFDRRYKGFANLSDNARDAIRIATDDKQVVDVLKAHALNDMLSQADRVNLLAVTAAENWQRYADRVVGDVEAGAAGVGDLLGDAFLRGDDAVHLGDGLWRQTSEGILERAVSTGNGDTLAVFFQNRKVFKFQEFVTFAKGDEALGVATLRKLVEPGTGKLTSEETDLLVRYGRAVGAHALDLPDGRRFLVDPDIVRFGDDLAPMGSKYDDLKVQAVTSQLAADAARGRTNEGIFVITDVPSRVRKSGGFWEWAKTGTTTAGTNRVQRGVRRFASRVSQPAPKDINIFQPKRAAVQIKQLFEHFGVGREADDLIAGFNAVDVGDRMRYIKEAVIPALGDATGVPTLRYQLVELFDREGVRAFSSGADELGEFFEQGARKNIPTLVSHLQDTIVIPIDEITQIVRRYQGGSTDSIRWRTRGFLGATRQKRASVVTRLEQQIVHNNGGELPADLAKLSPEQRQATLWDMAYSYVSPTADDGRGWVAGKMAPAVGSGWDKLHRIFTTSMLVFRPGQWAWRVAGIEEPIRAAIFNLPSLYRNPFTYAADFRAARLLNQLQRRRAKNLVAADQLHAGTVGAARTFDEAVDAARKLGIGDVVTDDMTSIGQVKAAARKFLDEAIMERVALDRLTPGSRLGLRLKHRTVKIEQGQDILARNGMADDFDLNKEDEIRTLLSTYFGQSAGASATSEYAWKAGMPDKGAHQYGMAWGNRVQQLVEDPSAKIGMRRIIRRLNGEAMDSTTNGEAVVRSAWWPKMRNNLQRKYPEISDEVELANRYMDEMVEREIRNLLSPVLDDLGLDDQAEVLDNLVNARRLKVNVAGESWDIKMTPGNVGYAQREAGNLARQAARLEPQRVFPTVHSDFDPRFMAVDERKMLTRLKDWTLQVFGEEATQVLNRRPAFIRTFRRSFDNYKNMGVPDDIARKMAHEETIRMVNYVFYDTSEAPYLVHKLNKLVPFFGATFEVMGTWVYKLPKEAGGYWPIGAPEFVRKIDRLMDGLVNLGIVHREADRGPDGEILSVRHTLNLVPVDDPTNEVENKIGASLRGWGFQALNGLTALPGHLLGLQEATGLLEGGRQLEVGNPLNPFDYGILSFANAAVSVTPVPNFLLTKAAGLLPGAGDYISHTTQEAISVADLADQLEVEEDVLLMRNREMVINAVGETTYNKLRAGTEASTDVLIPAGKVVTIPETNLANEFIKDFIQPFGGVADWTDLPFAMFPGVLKHGIMGLGVAMTPQDDFYEGDFGGALAAFIPEVNKAQMAAQSSEAIMYVEAHYPENNMQYIRDKIAEREAALAAGNNDLANELNDRIEALDEEYVQLIKEVTYGSMFLRSITGQFMPTSPRHIRQEAQTIGQFWASRDYAESLEAKVGKMGMIPNFSSVEEIDKFFEMTAEFLQDGTGDGAKAKFLEENPHLLAYLVPKSFYGKTGIPPEIESYADYQDQIESGERIVAPPHVTMGRAESSFIQAESHNDWIVAFGNDPAAAAAAAWANPEAVQELQEAKALAYDAMYLRDDMHGGIYDEWQSERYDSDDFALEAKEEKTRQLQESINTLIHLEDALAVETDLEGITNLRPVLRGAQAELRNHLEWLESQQPQREGAPKNQFEQAYNRYSDEILDPYYEGLSQLYDEIDEKSDSEEVSLWYEKIKMYKNEWANSTIFLGGDYTNPYPTPTTVAWNRKTDEERLIKAQQSMTRPLEWIDLDSALQMVAVAPNLESFLPTTMDQFTIYHQWTLDKITLEEMAEGNEITNSQYTKMKKQLEENVKNKLIADGRANEVLFMDATPMEKLAESGTLPASIGIFMPEVRWYRQALMAADVSAGSTDGDLFLKPLYDYVTEQAHQNPQLMEDLRTLGAQLYDKQSIDQIMPWLFFGTNREF